MKIHARPFVYECTYKLFRTTLGLLFDQLMVMLLIQVRHGCVTGEQQQSTFGSHGRVPSGSDVMGNVLAFYVDYLKWLQINKSNNDCKPYRVDASFFSCNAS